MNYNIEGFEFKTIEEYEAAKKEVQAVKYIKDRITGIGPQKTLDVYNRLIKDEMLSTPVGIYYLCELREQLLSMPGINSEDVCLIPIKKDVVVKEISNRNDSKVSTKSNEEKIKLKSKYKTSFVINIILVCMVVGMFFIAMTAESPTVLNYKSKIINNYEEWQKSLEEREQKVKELEKKYNINE